MNNPQYHEDTQIFDQERDTIQRLMLLADAEPIYRTHIEKIDALIESEKHAAARLSLLAEKCAALMKEMQS